MAKAEDVKILFPSLKIDIHWDDSMGWTDEAVLTKCVDKRVLREAMVDFIDCIDGDSSFDKQRIIEELDAIFDLGYYDERVEIGISSYYITKLLRSLDYKNEIW